MRKFFFFIAALCCVVMMRAEDQRTIISEITCTTKSGSFKSYFAAGLTWNRTLQLKAINNFTLQTSYVKLSNATNTSALLKWDSEQNKYEILNSNGTLITGGKYIYAIQFRLDDPNAATYRFETDKTKMKVIIDDVAWTIDVVANHDSYCVCSVISPEFELENVEIPLTYTHNTNMDYYQAYLGKPVDAHDLSTCVSGGTGTYTFSRVTSHITWLAISPSGILSGTPTALSDVMQKDTFRVDDGANHVDFAISVRKVYDDPANREEIHSGAITGFALPVYGSTYDKTALFSSLKPAEGALYTVFYQNSNGLYKKSGSTYVAMNNSEQIEAGDYMVKLEVRVNGENGYHYVIANDFTVTVNDEPWNVDKVVVWDNSSTAYISTTFTIEEPSTEAIDNTEVGEKAIKRIVNGQLIIEKNGKFFNALGAEVR